MTKLDLNKCRCKPGMAILSLKKYSIINNREMKKLSLITAVAVATLLTSFKANEATTWALDNTHAKLGFTTTHLMVSDVEGSFKVFKATITAPKSDFTDAVVEMSAEATSVNTDNQQRDDHVKGADFLNVEKYPTIDFKSNYIKPSKVAGVYIVKGNLTLHGVTKPVELSAIAKTGTNPMNQKAIAGFKITGQIKRSDFGIGASVPAMVISDEINLIANVEFVKN